MESIIVTLEFILSEDQKSWDAASMGLPFLESDSGWDDPKHQAEAVASMALTAIEQGITEHDGYRPFSDVRGYYADTSSENRNWQARWSMVEVGNLDTLQYKVDRANR